MQARKTVTALAIAAVFAAEVERVEAGVLDRHTECRGSRYRRAIEIDPATPGPYDNLAYLMAYALNRFADAVPLEQKAVDLDPDSPFGALGLASLYLDFGDESKSFATIHEQAAKRWPNDPGIQLWLALTAQLRGDSAGTVRHARRSLALYSRNPWALVLLRNADLQSGRYEGALARYRKAYPELFVGDAPRLDLLNYGVAVDLALVMQKLGDTARAKALFDAGAQVIGRIPRLGSGGYGITDVRIHALHGAKAEALAALREAEKVGWRGPHWPYYRDFDPNLDSIRNEPEFKATFADIERDMAQQRARLAARPKDAPLDLTETSR
jgi:tetratricopeptide (TPR) repeat protein